MARTVGDVVAQARVLLYDPIPSGSGPTLSGTSTLRTVGDAIAEARGFLNDRGVGSTPIRYPDSDLYTYFGTALLLLRRLRPDMFEALGTTATPNYTAADVNTPFPVDDGYFPAFVEHIVAAAQLRDDTQQQEQKAMTLAQSFAASLVSAPFRYADSFLYELVNEAISEMRRLRPDLFHGQLRLPQVLYTPADRATPLPVDDLWFVALVDYVIGRARSRNADHTKGADGAEYVATFVARLRQA